MLVMCIVRQDAEVTVPRHAVLLRDADGNLLPGNAFTEHDDMIESQWSGISQAVCGEACRRRKPQYQYLLS